MTRQQTLTLLLSGCLMVPLLLFPPWIWGYSYWKHPEKINSSKIFEDGDGIEYAFCFNPPRTPQLSRGVWNIEGVVGDNPDGTWSVHVFYELLAIEIAFVAIPTLLIIAVQEQRKRSFLKNDFSIFS